MRTSLELVTEGDDRHADQRERSQVGDDHVVAAVFEQAALRRGRDDGATGGEAVKQARKRRGVAPVVGMVLELDLEPMQRPAVRSERTKCARPECRPVLPRIEDVDRDRTVDQRRVCMREHD